MTERDNAGRLRELKFEISEDSGMFSMDELEDAVIAALRVPGPPGSPNEIIETATALTRSSIDVDTALNAIKQLRSVTLPDAWSGDAHVAAETALKAVERELQRTVDTLIDAAKALVEHGQNLEDDQKLDRRGMGPLENARDHLRGHTGLFDFDANTMIVAHMQATSGITDRHHAATDIRDSAERAASLLRDLTGAARLAKLSGSALDPVSELVIADAGGGGDADELILTPVMANRAQEAINRLGEDDRQRLETLLARAKSPEEQAYILKALGAGYTMQQVAEFDRLIHAHGDDPAWLKDRLSPLDTSDSSNDKTGSRVPTTSHGRPWDELPDDTCVAAANVMARAQVDPVYALQLTTGGHPGDPAHDNPAAFSQRLRDEQVRVYDQGRSPFGWFPMDGMNTWQSESIANENVAPHTGITYESQNLNNAYEREEALRRAEEAVDQGIPVPVGTRSHELLIVGHDGDRIQIYNPAWGTTVWVSREDFINGRMNDATSTGEAVDIRLPR